MTKAGRDTQVLFTVEGANIAPRFDQAQEVMIIALDDAGKVTDERTVVLPQPSAEELCQMILADGIDVLVCGGIEDQFYEYLTWKKVVVVDSVMGPWTRALRRLRADALVPGTVLFDRPAWDRHGL